MWYNNKKVTSTFVSYHSKNCWAAIESVGWKKIKPSTTDGSTNLFVMMCAAKANNRTVNVEIDTNNEITIAYLN